MIKLLFSIYDTPAKHYFPIMEMNTQDEAIRAFSDGLNNPEHGFSSHPEDYTLFYLGTIDTSTGTITPRQEGPNMLKNGLSLIQKDNTNGNSTPTLVKS
jgi:hypothetical protein